MTLNYTLVLPTVYQVETKSIAQLTHLAESAQKYNADLDEISDSKREINGESSEQRGGRAADFPHSISSCALLALWFHLRKAAVMLMARVPRPAVENRKDDRSR